MRQDLQKCSFMYLRCSGLSLKEFCNSVISPCMGWETLSCNDVILPIVLLSHPTTCTVSRRHPRTELAILMSLSNVFLSAVGKQLRQHITPILVPLICLPTESYEQQAYSALTFRVLLYLLKGGMTFSWKYINIILIV